MGIAYLIGRLDHVLSRRIRDGVTPLGVTVNQYTALAMLAAQPHLSNAQLAERALVTPQAANEMVKVMEGKGWIEREPDPSHGRIIQIRVTQAGQDLLNHCDTAVAQIEDAMLAEMGINERRALYAQLRELLHGLSWMMLP
jgi:DNA-binding MarR family transcriptional regulator